MNQSLVVKLNNTTIYLINDKNISYYLSIPNSSTNKVNIAVNIMSGLNNSNISSIYSKFDNPNICLISPIFQDNVYGQILNLNEQAFSYADKCISYLINTVYKILSTNNIAIDSKIKLIKNNTYISFEEWFAKRYQDRVETLIYQDNTNITNNPQTSNQPTPPIQSNSNITNHEQEKATSILDDTQDIVTSTKEEKPTPNEQKDLGFVSYVLLGVVVAVVSLVILYLLI